MKKITWLFCPILCLTLAPCLIHASVETNEEVPFVSLTRQGLSSRKLPTNISVLKREDLERSGAETVDEVLDQLPGIDLSRSGALGSFTTVRMRGVTGSAQVQVVVDDHPLGGVSNQSIDLAQIPVDSIERIEVVRGGSSVLYGANTIGGVIHIFTRHHLAEKPRVEVGFEGRSHQTKIVHANAGASGGGFDGFATVGKLRTDGFQQNSDAEQVNGLANVGYSFPNAARITFGISAVDHEVGNPRGTNVPFHEWNGEKERAAAETDARSEKTRKEGRLKVALPFMNAGTFQSLVYGSEDTLIDRPQVGATASFDQTNRIVGNDTRFIGAGGLTLGAAYERDEQETVGRVPSHITNWGLYVAQVFGRNRLTFIPGFRFDQHGTFGNEFNPRFTVVYRVLSRWSLSANAARSFRAPNFLELFYESNFFNGNPFLEPERAWTYDLGSEVTLSGNRVVKMTGYYTRVKDRIFPTMTTYINLNTAELSGFEFEMEGRIGPFRDILNYTFQRAKGNSGTTSKYVPLRLTPPHMANGTLIWDGSGCLKGFEVSNTVQYVARQYQSNGNQGEKLPSYGLWHARVTKKWGFGEVFLGVDNITNKRYAESFDSDPNTWATTFNPAPDRTYRGGVKITF